jgi:putative transposase
MMLDADIVAVSPSSVYRTLKAAGRIGPFNGKPSSKGTGFQHPLKAHEHWHIDVSYLNIHGTFYYLASILDGYSRSIIHFEIHESMTESQIEIILQRAPRLPCLWTTPGGSSSNTSFTTTPSASTAPSAM